MTSLVSRNDVIDTLYNLAPSKPRDIQRAMQVIERYAVTVAERIRQNESLMDDAPENHGNLKPGETDLVTGVRRCLSCGKVRSLTKYFNKEARAPHGRKLRCIDCRPPQNWSDGRVRGDQYMCQGCNTRKALKHFPPAKRKKPALLMHCNDCRKAHPERYT